MKNSILFIAIVICLFSAISSYIWTDAIYQKGRTEGHAAAMRQCKEQNSIKQDSTPTPQTMQEILDATFFNY